MRASVVAMVCSGVCVCGCVHVCMCACVCVDHGWALHLWFMVYGLVGGWMD
jgi:hypothetical protein